jgi:hypothetical protein
MKKESTFKMKGFSGFGTEESPAKKKTVTINKDTGGKTVTRTRRDGTVRKVKEFKPGKKKAFKTTKTKRSGDTVTREFKKGVRGATITKRQSPKSGADIYEGGRFKKHVPAGGIISQTTRKQRRAKLKSNLRETGRDLVQVALPTAGALMAAAAFPAAAGAAAKVAGLSFGGGVLSGIGRGVRDKAKKVIGNIKRKRKNPNRNRL